MKKLINHDEIVSDYFLAGAVGIVIMIVLFFVFYVFPKMLGIY